MRNKIEGANWPLSIHASSFMNLENMDVSIGSEYTKVEVTLNKD